MSEQTNPPTIDVPDLTPEETIGEPVPQSTEPVEKTETQQTQEEKKKQHIHATESVVVDEAWDDDDPYIPMPSVTNEELRDRLGQLPNVDLMTDHKSRDWGNVLRDGQDLVTYGDVFVDSLTRDGAQFEQSISHNNAKLQAAAPKLKAAENETLRGERAILRVARDLGLGTTFQVPCWHSGIWVTFKPPTETELIALNRAMVASKIRLGYNTYGLAYSNITSYTVDHLVDFMQNHIYATTVKNEELPFTKLMDHIYVQDLFTLIWGIACSIYPKGFQFRRACANDPEKCNHITEETLNLAKLQWIDSSQLNDWQKAHMAVRKPFERDLASLKKYHDEMLVLKNNRVKISRDGGADVYINLKSPTISQYVNEGHMWIGEIIDKVNQVLTTNDADDERNIIVQRYGQASSMRQYTQWVESIELDTNTIDDPETIRSVLDVLSGDDYVREKFLTEVVKYINNSTIAVLGIPSYVCPKCNKDQTGTDVKKEFESVIPLDVIQYFFSLTTQRIQRIALR